MNQNAKADDVVSVLSMEEAPDISYFFQQSYAVDDSFFNHEKLADAQIPASSVKEIKNLISDLNIPDCWVVFCRIEGYKGCVYLEGEVEWPVIFIDPLKINSISDLQDTYIHELSHLTSDGQGHDFVFSVFYNFYLIKVFSRTTDMDYDYSDCCFNNKSLESLKEESKYIANYIYEKENNEILIEQIRNIIDAFDYESIYFLDGIKNYIDSIAV